MSRSLTDSLSGSNTAILPRFLVVGAAKCGTTSLWAMLNEHPDIFLPTAKEPSTLAKIDARKTADRRLYARYFKGAKPEQICGEASTVYTSQAVSERAAENALLMLGTGLKLIYMVRHPVDRAISHHAHMHRIGRSPADFSAAVKADPDLVERGCYVRQLAPWRARFPDAQLLILRTEDLDRDPEGVSAKVFDFLGVSRLRLNTKQVNTRDTARVRTGLASLRLVEKALKSQFYRSVLKPYLPSRLIASASALTSKRAGGSGEAIPPDREACLHLWGRLFEPQVEALRVLMKESNPPWQIGDSRYLSRLDRKTNKNEGSASA